MKLLCKVVSPGSGGGDRGPQDVEKDGCQMTGARTNRSFKTGWSLGSQAEIHSSPPLPFCIDCGDILQGNLLSFIIKRNPPGAGARNDG